MLAFLLVVVTSIGAGIASIGDLMGNNWNIGQFLFASVPVVENIYYILAGLSAVFLMATHKKDCSTCSSPTMPGM